MMSCCSRREFPSTPSFTTIECVVVNKHLHMATVVVGGVRMKYPSAFVVTSQPPGPKETKTKPSPPDKCDKCMGVIVSRISEDNLHAGKREGDVNSVWGFSESQNRNNCACVKVCDVCFNRHRHTFAVNLCHEICGKM